jgi:hypothetical protein
VRTVEEQITRIDLRRRLKVPHDGEPDVLEPFVLKLLEGGSEETRLEAARAEGIAVLSGTSKSHQVKELVGKLNRQAKAIRSLFEQSCRTRSRPSAGTMMFS